MELTAFREGKEEDWSAGLGVSAGVVVDCVLGRWANSISTFGLEAVPRHRRHRGTSQFLLNHFTNQMIKALPPAPPKMVKTTPTVLIPEESDGPWLGGVMVGLPLVVDVWRICVNEDITGESVMLRVGWSMLLLVATAEIAIEDGMVEVGAVFLMEVNDWVSEIECQNLE